MCVSVDSDLMVREMLLVVKNKLVPLSSNPPSSLPILTQFAQKKRREKYSTLEAVSDVREKNTHFFSTCL